MRDLKDGTTAPVRGDYFAPRRAEALSCTAHLNASAVHLEFDRSHQPLSVSVTQVQGRTLMLDNEGQFTAVDALPEEWESAFSTPTRTWIRHAKQLHLKGLLALAVAFIVLINVYRIALPKISDWVAMRIPHSVERSISNQSYASLIQTKLLQSSQLPTTVIQQLERDYAELVRTSGAAVNPMLAVHYAPVLGANAIAFPGGQL